MNRPVHFEIHAENVGQALAFPGMAWQGYYLDPDNNIFGLHPESRTVFTSPTPMATSLSSMPMSPMSGKRIPLPSWPPAAPSI